MSTAVKARGLSRRFKACFYLSAINFCAMALPTLQPSYVWAVLIFGFVSNAIACWLILRNVEPMSAPQTHEMLAAWGRKAMLGLGVLGGVLLLTLGMTERLGKQAIPFVLFGFSYFSVASRVLGISIDKRIDEPRTKS